MRKTIFLVVGIIVFSFLGFLGFFIYGNFQDTSDSQEVLKKYWELALADKIEEANQLTYTNTEDIPPHLERVDGKKDCCFQEEISPMRINIISIEKTEIYRDNVGLQFNIFNSKEEIPNVLAPTIAIEILVEDKYSKKDNLVACFGINIKDNLWKIRKIYYRDESKTLKDICFVPIFISQ